MKPPNPDPWSPEVEQAIQNPESQPVCHRCITPHPPEAWFCPVCGTSVGPYNNYMPYVDIFPQGEVFRAGVSDHVRKSFLTIFGYLVLSLCGYLIFAPIYWYFLFRNFRRHTQLPGQDI